MLDIFKWKTARKMTKMFSVPLQPSCASLSDAQRGQEIDGKNVFTEDADA